jgi:uncharacterized protein (TIGR02594 family)
MGLSATADARPHRHSPARHHAVKHVPPAPAEQWGMLSFGNSSTAESSPARGGARKSNARAAATQDGATPSFGFGGGSALVAEARRYLGGNPTGWSHLWCGAFMDMILRRTGHPGGGNLARAYASYGHRVSGPQVGAIAVMSRGKSGGHVGVVSGIDSDGNPIIISGNHNHRVAEAKYPRGRIYAYVMP